MKSNTLRRRRSGFYLFLAHGLRNRIGFSLDETQAVEERSLRPLPVPDTKKWRLIGYIVILMYLTEPCNTFSRIREQGRAEQPWVAFLQLANRVVLGSP